MRPSSVAEQAGTGWGVTAVEHTEYGVLRITHEFASICTYLVAKHAAQ